MRKRRQTYLWQQMPFIRLLLPLCLGILLQWYISVQSTILISTIASAIVLLILYKFLSLHFRYKLRWLAGIVLHAGIIAAGAFLVTNHWIANDANWIGNHYSDSMAVMVTIDEPLVEKKKSYKADGVVKQVQTATGWREVKGKVIVYFKKDSIPPTVGYGSQIVFYTPLQKIKNSGNPGQFDYVRFNAFKGIHHQVYLKEEDFIITGNGDVSTLNEKMLAIKLWVIAQLKQYIYGEREVGVAEALIVGYRNDLDKDLVQAYSNAGVVHIIAISGLHLGMIYGILVWLLKGMRKTKYTRWLRPILMLVVLWIFCLVAGAAASIVRSAIMFSAIIIGEAINKRSPIYNSLAASAFVMLCCNPFLLWDVGFQLSYTAVLSIVIFMKPIYNWLYFTNKALDGVWKMCSVTLSAQVLTFPVVIYYFHQFPTLFLFSNLLVVPLATIILSAQLLLLAFSFLKPVAVVIGQFVESCLRFMNNFIEAVNELPYAVFDGAQNTVLQTWMLYTIIIALSWWLLRQQKAGLIIGAIALLVFVTEESLLDYKAVKQQKLIVYNVPQHKAIDVIEGNAVKYLGDENVITDPFLFNFHLKPARNLFKLNADAQVTSAVNGYPFLLFNGKRILIVDKPLKFITPKRIAVDAVVISNNPKVYIKDLLKAFDAKVYIFDASNPLWKINLWKKDCDSLHLRHYSTPDHGAYVMDL